MNDHSFPFKQEIEVAWGEMDAFGHVNNTIYLRYFENVRIPFFESLGLPFPKNGVPSAGPILASSRCEYRRPVVFPDKLTVEVGCNRVGKSSMTLLYRIFSHSQQAQVADGETVLVYFDYAEGRSKPIPAEVLQNLAERGMVGKVGA